MTIRVKCTCGKVLAIADEHAGKKGKCPTCGNTFPIPLAPSPAAADAEVHEAAHEQGGLPDIAGETPIARQSVLPMAPPPGAAVRTPTEVPEKLRSPGLPPCGLVLLAQGASIEADFDVQPVLDAFVETFAKRMKKRYDVCLGPSATSDAPNVEVRVVNINAGSRFLRYLLLFIAGKTCFEVEGHAAGETGEKRDFSFRHRSSGGLFGGNSLGLLKSDARRVAKKVAKLTLKLAR